MTIHILHREQFVPRPLPEVFSFFADAWNLERITPPWLHFHIITPRPLEMKAGARIDYRLRLRGLPVRWSTEICEWRPNEQFVDLQRRGPYRLWRHTHRFRAVQGGVWMTDVVQYSLRWGIIGGIAHRLFVRRDVEAIFDYRARQIDEIFPSRAGRALPLIPPSGAPAHDATRNPLPTSK